MCVRVVSIDPLSVFDVYLYTERERVRESEREGDKRDLLYRQKRPAIQKKRPTIEAKETYYRGKRDLLQRQKRPTIEAKETYYRGKRDLL